jgi:Uma2 family endonuclease
MTSLAVPSAPATIVYPDSDGKPMSDNTLQYQWIVTITGGLSLLFAEDPAVFVAGDLLWYPVEGRPEIRTAPDTMVAFGRPKGHRGSYRQWEEGGVAPQVVFEILSPGNRAGELSRKFGFYERYGVEEYYIYNPDPPYLELSGFVRGQNQLLEVEAMNGHVSPRLGVRFELGADGLRILRPDGDPFLTFEELGRRAEQERQRAEQERQRAEQERQRADEAVREAEALRRRLRDLGHAEA